MIAVRYSYVVLRLMQGDPVDGLSRRLAVPVWQLEEWRQRGLAGIDAELRERDDDAKERELAEAHRRIGEWHGKRAVAWRSRALWSAGGRADGRRDLAGDRSDLWRAPGLAIWRVAQSSFYDAGARTNRLTRAMPVDAA